MEIDLATHATLAEASPPEAARIPSRKEAYVYLCRMLVRFACRKRRKVEEVLLRAYLRCTTRPTWARGYPQPIWPTATCTTCPPRGPTHACSAPWPPNMQAPIGLLRKPRPEARPGWVRVESMDQGDLEKGMGVYLINAVDEPSNTRSPPRGAHLQELSAAGPRACAGIVPPCRAGLPHRQRLRVGQLPGGRAAGEATRGGVHQVAPAA